MPELQALSIVDYGIFGVFIAFFAVLLKWTLAHFDKIEAKYQDIIKESAEREKNYQSIIAKLSDELPEMRETLARIESKIKDPPKVSGDK